MSKAFTAQTIEMALQAISSALHPTARQEILGIDECGGRVLAQSVVAPKDIPESPLSAMDGYAFHSSRLDKLSGDSPLTLKVLGKSLAGHGLEGQADPGSCIRIFTGAVVPPEHDTVIPQELVAVNDAGDEIRFSPDAIRPLANVRTRGEDLARGAVALTKGSRMGPREIALLASMGIASVGVTRRLRVAVISTGDEVTDPVRPLAKGKTFDANRPMLLELLREIGADAVDLGIVEDDPDALRQSITHAATISDALITSGGVSVGEADHTRDVMQSLGDISFWKLAIKPGRPLAAGWVGPSRIPFFGLPGNPVAAFVTFHAIVKPCLARIAGEEAVARPPLRARLAHDTKKAPGRTEYLRCGLQRDPHGDWVATIARSQGAASLKSLVDADGLVVLPHEAGPLSAGTMVDVIALG